MRRVLLAAIFCLLVSSMANAEAWVFWERTSYNLIRKEGKWESMRAFPTYNECMEFLQSEILSDGKMLETAAKQDPNLVVTVNLERRCVISEDYKRPERSYISEYRCFPDTIDPRK